MADASIYFQPDATRSFTAALDEYRRLVVENERDPSTIRPTRDRRRAKAELIKSYFEVAGVPHGQPLTLGDFGVFTITDADGGVQLVHFTHKPLELRRGA